MYFSKKKNRQNRQIMATVKAFLQNGIVILP